MGSGLPEPEMQVGSDFEWVDSQWLTVEPSTAPWVPADSGLHVQYLSTGRQALSLVARHLWSLGRRRVMIPAHHCESMVTPFLEAGFDVRLIALDRKMAMDPASLESEVQRPRYDVILETSLFGSRTPQALSEVLTAHEAAGRVVITDATHQVFDPPENPARMRVASLRKLLPIPDGAFVVSEEKFWSSCDSPILETVAARERAMRAKAMYINGAADDADYRTLYLQTEAELTSSLKPHWAAPVSVDLIRHLDYPQLRARRRYNLASLYRHLEPCVRESFLDIHGAGTPAYGILSVSQPTVLREYLIRRGIYCPIHWPPVAGIPNWRTDLLSIPVDHRYDETHMARVAVHLNRWFLKKREVVQ